MRVSNIESFLKRDVTSIQSLHVNHWLWEKRLKHQYTPHAGYIGDGSRIRLLLGVQGKGLNHLARLVTQGMHGISYMSDPVERFHPKVTLSLVGERTAIRYHKELGADHPLVRVYRILVENGVKWSDFSNQTDNANEFDMKCLFLKEHNGLLATEALLRELRCHVLLYLSDPVVLAEQIFSQQDIDTPYLVLESQAVIKPEFLQRFLRNDLRAVLHAYKVINRLPIERERIIQTKIFTIALIQHMFRMLAARYPELATIVDYDQVSKHPLGLQFPIVNWLGEDSIEASKRLLSAATFTPAGGESLKWKSSWPEEMISYETLSHKEVNMAYQMLIDCGLMRNDEIMSQAISN